MQDKNNTDWFEKLGPLVAGIGFLFWLAWCTPDIVIWFSRF